MNNLYSAYTIKNTLNLLTAYKKSISSKSDLQKIKNRFIGDINLMTTFLQELIFATREGYTTLPVSCRQMIRMQNDLENMIPRIRNLQEGEQIQINEITNKLEEFKEYSFSEFSLYEAERWVSYLEDNLHDSEREELNSRDVHTIMSNINTNRPYNIFSPRCGKGQGLQFIKNYGEATTYGLEERENYHPIAKNVLDRVIKGKMQGSKISNDCFDIMHVVPPISWIAEIGATGNLIEKKEKSWLRNTIKYLRKDGILIFTLPKTRLTRDMAFIFSKLLEDVQVLKASNVSGELDYIHVIGKKHIVKDSRNDVYAYLSNIPNMEILPTELDITYDLPSGGINLPELFRGSVLDESELEYLIANSGLISSFWKQQEIEEKDTNMRPLLPFNMGQIGLVLTSGCLDGVVEEFEGQYHAIKGMVTKVRDFNNSVENNDETSIETISNKVQINLLTPDGKFIELA